MLHLFKLIGVVVIIFLSLLIQLFITTIIDFSLSFTSSIFNSDY